MSEEKFGNSLCSLDGRVLGNSETILSNAYVIQFIYFQLFIEKKEKKKNLYYRTAILITYLCLDWCLSGDEGEGGRGVI